jgi:hypothetical protein
MDDPDDGEDENNSPEQSRLRTMIHAWAILKLNIHMNYFNYKIDKPTSYDSTQTQILANEIKSRNPDTFFVVRALETGADPNVIIGKHIERALHRAARKGNVKIVEYLVQAGADINALNGRHQTPLIVATDTKRTDKAYIDVVRFLARHRDANIEIADVGGNTALLNGKCIPSSNATFLSTSSDRCANSGIFSNNVWVTR